MEAIARKKIQRVEVARKLQKITRRYGIWNLYNKKKGFSKVKLENPFTIQYKGAI